MIELERPAVIGLDLSLTATGVAGFGWCESIRTKRKGHDRLSFLLEAVKSYTHGADLVVIEGPAHSRALQKGHHELAGFWWLVTHVLWRKGIPYAVADPTAVKKYATGRGNAGKDEVLIAAVRRYPGAPIESNDEADAFVLAAMGFDWRGCAPVAVPQSHRAALGKVAWPEAVTAP